MGDIKDVTNFMNAVIDEKSFDNISSYIDYAKHAPDAQVIAGGQYDKSKGYFIRPTVVETTNPHLKLMEEEIFGPVLTVYVYEDKELDKALELCDTTSPYGLTELFLPRTAGQWRACVKTEVRRRQLLHQRQTHRSHRRYANPLADRVPREQTTKPAENSTWYAGPTPAPSRKRLSAPRSTAIRT